MFKGTAIASPTIYKAGSTRGTSVTDVAVTAQLLVEAGMGSKSKLPISTPDVASYFDTIAPGKLVTHLAVRINNAWLVAVGARLHLRPQIELTIFGNLHALPRRKCGLITGSSSAATLQRIPLEDVISYELQFLTERAAVFQYFQTGVETRFAVAFW